MQLAGSLHCAADVLASPSPPHRSSSSSSWASRGTGCNMGEVRGDTQASRGQKQVSSSHAQASARSVSMALFALAVLWPVLLAEEHRQESRRSTSMRSHANSSSKS
eukprot:scaffold84448_cov17-Tisochrysis_lutea.AAC.1